MQADATIDWSTPAVTETNRAIQSVSQPQPSYESGLAVEESAEQKQASTQQETAPNVSDSTHSHNDPDRNIVQVIVDPHLLK